MLKLSIAAFGFALAASGAHAQLPEADAAAHPFGSFLQVAADAGQRVIALTGADPVEPRQSSENSDVQITVIVPGVPEPETYAMLAAGLAAVGFMVRRRNR